MTTSNSTATVNINMVAAIITKIAQSNYATTSIQKKMIEGWCRDLGLLSNEAIAELKSSNSYKVMIEPIEAWLEAQGQPVQIQLEQPTKTVGTIISKPVKKADQPQVTGFDHIAFFTIIDKMVKTKQLHGAKNTKTAKVIKLELAYQLVDGTHEFVTIKQTHPDGTAKDPGSVYVHINDEWCLNIGTANTGNALKRRADFDFTAYPWFDGFLSDFVADPASVAAKSGKLTKRCCICSLKLDDPKSLSVGYGKKCAQNMGWPYGTTVKEIITGEALLTQALQLTEVEAKPEVMTATTATIETPISQIQIVKDVIQAYGQNALKNYTALMNVALATVPGLKKRGKGVYYLDALVAWLDEQQAITEPTSQPEVEVPTEVIEVVQPAPMPEVRLTESEFTVNRTIEPTPTPQPEITEVSVSESQPAVKLSAQSQAVLDSVKGVVSAERYAELYIQMLSLESQTIKPKKQRSSTGTPKAKKQKDYSAIVNEIAKLCDLADSKGMQAAIEASGRNDPKYMPRAYRSYREIYQVSEKIRKLVDDGLLAWGSVHHYLAGRNPKRCGIAHLEDFAQALVDGLWIDTPSAVNPRPKAYNKAAGELPPQD